jgi:CubicO group peptidase (beta-lactamase class C family)
LIDLAPERLEHPEPYLDLLGTAGDGAMISTVNDYALWIQALLGVAQGNASLPITPRLYHDLVFPRSILPESQDFANPPLYGLGWYTAQVGRSLLVTHGGAVTGFGTEIFMFPRESYEIVTMGNTYGTSNVAGAAIASRLITEKLNIEVSI